MNDVIIIGAGIAGLECAQKLCSKGYKVTLIEKKDSVGGHVAQWNYCFPFGTNGSTITNNIINNTPNIQIKTSTEVTAIDRDNDNYIVKTNTETISAKAILIANGYNLFDAQLKEELGYGVYSGVMTSEDLECQWRNGERPLAGHKQPRFAIIHCVGSRDLKCDIHHCSKVCCMVGVKTAIEIKERYPDSQVTNYYMDLRMFDNGYEELYHKAQLDYNVQFVRGRVSEVSPTNEGRLAIRAEDTLLGKPIRDKVDALVLMVGMAPAKKITIDGEAMAINGNGFVQSLSHIETNKTERKGIFVAGGCKGPMNITEVLADARAAAAEIDNYLAKA